MYGTNTTLDALQNSTIPVLEFGEERAFDAIENAFVAHNAIVREMLTGLVERTTDRLRRYGGQDTMTMDELDPWGTPDAQKVVAGVDVGFPLRKYGGSLQWTRTALQVLQAQQVAAQATAMMTADVKAVQREIKKALLTATNASFIDKLTAWPTGITLPIKRLVNADSAGIPDSPNGISFNGATHTHYLYTAGTTLAASDLKSAVDTVIEHYNGGDVSVYINRAQEDAVRALTGFTAYIDARIISADTISRGTAKLDPSNLYNRAIGLFEGAQVEVKPWVPAGYLLPWINTTTKPLAMRTRLPDSGDLQLVYEDEEHPLRARVYEREFGVAVWERTGAAALYIDVNSASAYVAPTIT